MCRSFERAIIFSFRLLVIRAVFSFSYNVDPYRDPCGGPGGDGDDPDDDEDEDEDDSDTDTNDINSTIFFRADL